MDFFHPNVPLTYYSDKASYTSKVDVNWTLYIDARSWGIKDLSPAIKDDVLKFTIEIEDESTGETQEKQIELDIRYVNAKVKYVRGDGIWPVEIEIDENNGKALSLEITFTLPK